MACITGEWTSPGDFGRMSGRLSPDWWQADVNQYGLMKVLRINANGTFIDGLQISEMTIHDVQWETPFLTFRISAEERFRAGED